MTLHSRNLEQPNCKTRRLENCLGGDRTCTFLNDEFETYKNPTGFDPNGGSFPDLVVGLTHIPKCNPSIQSMVKILSEEYSG